jgi:MFS family permease
MNTKMPLAELFALFERSPAFKRVFLADLATQLGDGGLLVAFPLLILHGTHDVTLTGLAFSFEILAFGLLSPVAGGLADRLEQKALMVGANLVRMALLGALLAALALGLPMGVCLGLSALLGATGAFFVPARAAFMRRLLDGEALEQAVAVEGTVAFLVRVVSPALMGVLVAAFPPTVAIWADVLAYGVAAWLLAPARVTGPRLAAAEGPGGDWLHGWRVIGASRVLRELLVLDVLLSLVGMAAFAITLAYLETVLHLPGRDNGWLLATTGLAGAAGTQLAGRLPAGSGRFALLTGMVALTYMLVPAMPGLAGMMAVWALRGVAIGALCVLLNQAIAREAPAEAMGRVTAAWGLAACLASFAGSMATPVLLRTVGAASSYVLFGTLLALLALALAWRALVAPLRAVHAAAQGRS